MAKGKNQKPPENTIPLQDAFFALCDQDLLLDYQEAKECKKVIGVVCGIRSFEARDIRHESEKCLARLEKDFRQKLQDGTLTGWAREGSALAPVQEIPASAWMTLRLKSLPKNLVKGAYGDLYDVRIVNNAPTDAPPHEKGRGGRPSEMPTILEEYEKRQKAGRYEGSNRSEAYYLESWFKKNFPDRKSPHPKTIQHHLSEIGIDSSAKNK